MRRSLIILLLLAGSAPAFAQQTANNAVTQAEDAFGRASGNEKIGIYSSEEVRGFNPAEAGNNRLEGLYIDQTGIMSPRVVDGSSIRVGYAARGTAFPAPTGIVDIRIKKFTGTTRGNAELEWEDYANVGGALEGKLALDGDRLGLALGLGFREADQVQTRDGSFRSFMGGLSWYPDKATEFTVFAGGYASRRSEMPVTLFPAGSYAPPRQPRKLHQSQPWALNRFGGMTSGAVFKTSIGAVRLEAGLFRTGRYEPRRLATLLLGTQSDGRVAEHVVIAERNNRTESTSGELRLSRILTSGNLRHNFILSVRGRDQDRAFGGQQRISLGASQAGVQDFRPKPLLAFGPKDHSNVRQLTYGLQYTLQSTSGSQFSLAAQRADYRKTTDFANIALADTVARDRPWLISANGALVLADGLTAYGGYVRGLEESAIAPDISVNRSEAPPALRTRQMDMGLRYALTPKLALIAGAFDITKPYYGVDAGLRFGKLGRVTNRGVEISLAGTLAKGLTVVAGGILITPQISGPEVAAGRIGKRPVGTFRQRGILNLDWKPAGQEAWSFDLAVESVSSEAADRLNSFDIDGVNKVNLGARYRFILGGSHVLVRGQVLNLFDSYVWRVNSSSGFTTQPTRTFTLQTVVDF